VRHFFYLPLFVVAAVCLSGCSSNPDNSATTVSSQAAAKERVDQQMVELGRMLFPRVPRNASIAIGSILPAASLSYGENESQPVVIQQIQENLYSLATDYALTVHEHRMTPNIRLHEGSDQMLSRNPQELRSRLQVDYFLTGTYTETEGGYLVNTRIVQIRNQQVLQAATHFFPRYAANQSQAPHSEWRSNGLWRSEFAPEKSKTAPPAFNRIQENNKAR